MLKQILGPGLCFFRNQICHEHTVDPGLSCCRGEWSRAELQQRIEITEENDGYIDALSNVSRARERVAHSRAASQRSFRRALNHFAVRDWIAEREAQLDDVCSSFREFN